MISLPFPLFFPLLFSPLFHDKIFKIQNAINLLTEGKLSLCYMSLFKTSAVLEFSYIPKYSSSEIYDLILIRKKGGKSVIFLQKCKMSKILKCFEVFREPWCLKSWSNIEFLQLKSSKYIFLVLDSISLHAGSENCLHGWLRGQRAPQQKNKKDVDMSHKY